VVQAYNHSSLVDVGGSLSKQNQKTLSEKQSKVKRTWEHGSPGIMGPELKF
jgi:hypothetical protein